MWITDGDRNMSFFHQNASNGRQRNTIHGLTNDNETWHEDDQMMEKIVLEYFSNIFQSSRPTNTAIVVAAIQPIVIDSMNRQNWARNLLMRGEASLLPKTWLEPDIDGRLVMAQQHKYGLTDGSQGNPPFDPSPRQTQSPWMHSPRPPMTHGGPPPYFPWYKVNTDATVFKNSNSFGIGVVVRDHEGSVLAALSKHLPLPLGPLEAEAKAMEESISFATDIGIQEAIFETDSLALLGALADMSTVLITIENCIGGIHLKLQNFRQPRVQHVRHERNKPAHTLEHYAKGIDNFVT
ncbi:hypothetical protein SO802_026322 [Lithocarpus litseifolius]|uniref:RNase H type-1 domain-containing protein n=1 Tax=Lithocarpus litseifolius TaxID=425828 RepID=A0AAW2C1X2_9ROSI